MKGVETLINRHKWHNHFHTIQTADNAPSKPNPGMIEAAMKETGVAPERAIMIGDTSFDMEMANNAGIKTIAVTWGYHSTEVLSAYQPDHMVEDMIALKAAISALTG